MSQFSSGGQSSGVLASASVLPMNIKDWFPLGLTGWISLQSGTLKSLLQHHSSKASILQHMYTHIHTHTHTHIYITLGFSVRCYGKRETYIHMYLYFYSSFPVFVSKNCTYVCYSGWNTHFPQKTMFSCRVERSHVAQSVKCLPAMQERAGSTIGSGSSPGEGNGNPLQYSCLENPMDRGAWQATVHGITRVRHDLVLSFFIFPAYWNNLAWHDKLVQTLVLLHSLE